MTALLLISHPGHEMRVLEWVRRNRPRTVILTQGDGASGDSRLEESARLLDQVGARLCRSWLEPVPDKRIYGALLGRHESPFPAWLAALVKRCAESDVQTIVADSAEGYNPSHDLCRALANQLVRDLRSRGKPIASLEFPLDGHPNDPARREQVREQVQMSGDEVKDKIFLALDYARRTSVQLHSEIESMLEKFGEEAFQIETFYAAQRTTYEDGHLPDETPHFETVGEERTKSGVYRDVIRARHLLNLIQNMSVG